MIKRFNITEAELRRLYDDEELSVSQIAEILGCSPRTVRRRMQEHDIPRRLPRYDIAEVELRRLHDEEGLTQREIAEVFGCSESTISNKMYEYGIRPRSQAEARIMAWGYLRHDFDGDQRQRAYYIGFCKGDLHVETPHENSETIVVWCNSTKPEQIKLVYDLFSPYGRVWVGKRDKRGNVQIKAYLNLTFSFLLGLEDNIPAWILTDDELFFAFLAGYTDAEGSIGIYRGHARFRLASYDQNILHQAHTMLLAVGIKCPKPRIHAPKGYIVKNGHGYNQDLWGLTVYRKDSLLLLFERIGPYLQHAKRVQDMQAALRSIKGRNTRRSRR